MLRSGEGRGSLTASYERLMISVGFNKPILQLPPSVTHLHFDYGYKEEITDLPPTVTSLSYGYRFKITNFPPHLTHLTLIHTELPLLPSTLTYLNCAVRLLRPLSHLTKLEELRISGDADSSTVPALPPSIKVLDINLGVEDPVVYQSLPPALRVFRTTTVIPPIDNLPPLLTELEFGDSFNQPVDNLPSSLTRIKFGRRFNQLVNKLPPFLTQLSFGVEFDQPVDHLPPALTNLHLGNWFTHPVDHLPPSLIHLHIGNSFNSPTNYLPATLRHLHLGSKFNDTTKYFPPITHLSFGHDFRFSQDAHPLPPSITHALFGIDPNTYSENPYPRRKVEVPHLSHYYCNIANNHSFDVYLPVSESFKTFTLQMFNPDDIEHAPHLTCYVNFETRMIHVSFRLPLHCLSFLFSFFFFFFFFIFILLCVLFSVVLFYSVLSYFICFVLFCFIFFDSRSFIPTGNITINALRVYLIFVW